MHYVARKTIGHEISVSVLAAAECTRLIRGCSKSIFAVDEKILPNSIWILQPHPLWRIHFTSSAYPARVCGVYNLLRRPTASSRARMTKTSIMTKNWRTSTVNSWATKNVPFRACHFKKIITERAFKNY